MSGWDVFTPERMGTPITEQERVAIYESLREMEAWAADEEWIKRDVESWIELVGSWDRSLTVMCLDHDLNMLRSTLATGIVTEGGRGEGEPGPDSINF